MPYKERKRELLLLSEEKKINLKIKWMNNSNKFTETAMGMFNNVPQCFQI